MIKKLYFISGLPRAGSTLLSAILNQNPRFYSGPTSPVVKTMYKLTEFFNNDELFLAYPKVNETEKYIVDFIKYYYADINQEIIFDKNRFWTEIIDTIKNYFKIEPKIICTVRDIAEIYTSIQNTKLKLDHELLTPNDNLIVGPYKALKDAFTKHRELIHIVEYNSLVNNPKETMIDIYKFLGENYYQHTFNSIEQQYKENDLTAYGVNLHTVRSKLNLSTTKPTQDIIDKCKGMEFWR